jgi:hypothetical protein
VITTEEIEKLIVKNTDRNLEALRREAVHAIRMGDRYIYADPPLVALLFFKAFGSATSPVPEDKT